MKPAELDRYLGPSLSGADLKLDEVQDNITYGDRPAWAAYYRGRDCKLQIYSSAREGGVNFMLAPLNAPNEYGLTNASKAWDFMLRLSDVRDDLQTPGMGADENTLMWWLKALFDIHFESARAALLARDRSREKG